MGRARRDGEPSSYRGRTRVPPTLARRYELVTTALGGQRTISAAATELGIARVNMQTLVHRAQAAVVATLQPQPTGRAPMPPRERALRAEATQLRRRNAGLERQVQELVEMLRGAGEIIHNLRGQRPRTSTTSSAEPRSSATAPTSDEDPAASSSTTSPEDATRAAVRRVAPMARHRDRAARALGVRAPTLRRWLRRAATGAPLCRPRGGRRAPVPPAQERAMRDQVRRLGGLVGAASLARSVQGVSRRSALAIKRDELTAMERDRLAASDRVRVAAPAVVRGFDAMHVDDAYLLVAADAAVPYRTSITWVPSYDADHVARVLAADFERHGAPLVLRLDRARCHDAPAVVSVLQAHRVLALHGPPHHPGYYGQLERQNREHRAWLARDARVSPAALEQMRTTLNGAWRRPTLGWCTAEDIWHARAPPADDRDEFHDWVQRRAARLREHDVTDDLATRLAIEQALIERGYLTITTRATLLCE